MCNCNPQPVSFRYFFEPGTVKVTVTKHEETPAERYQRVGRKALRAIADHIQTIADKNWKMNVWQEFRDCGTVGCAVGSSCGLPAVTAAGLSLVEHSSYGRVFPKCGDKWSFEAVALAFGITREQAHSLFDHWNYGKFDYEPSQHVVAARIYKFVLDN